MATLKELRQKQALSQADLAIVAGIAKSTIVAIENNQRVANFKTRRKLAKALKVQPSDIDF